MRFNAKIDTSVADEMSCNASSVPTTAITPITSGRPGGDDAAEHEQQRDGGERRGDDLRALDVLLRLRAHLTRDFGEPGDVGAEHVGALRELGRQALGRLDPFPEVAVQACR